jgi:hypothetical protein
LEKGTLLAMVSHFSNMDGKAAKRAGKSEDLSEQKALITLKNTNREKRTVFQSSKVTFADG